MGRRRQVRRSTSGSGSIPAKWSWATWGPKGKKMDYTVIGDNVNLGARLEGLTRQYNSHIIISELPMKVKDMVQVNELGSVTVKGKQLPVVIYDLIG